jgi:hypothetical protein
MGEELAGGTTGAVKGNASQEEIKELTQQFYVTLRAYVARLDEDDEGRSPKAFQQIESLLKDGSLTWSDAYQIEQLLVDLFDEGSLEVELQSRLLEAESALSPPLAAQYAKRAGAARTTAQSRALLARLINDLQWRYTVNEVKRTYSKEITKLTGKVFIVGIASFVTAVLGTAAWWRWNALAGAGDATQLLLAGLAGGWGAGFSMLASLKGRLDAAELDDLKLMKSRWILWSRPLIGVGAACILYFFLVSGLLTGSAFPDLVGPESKPISRSDAALLVVWCFLAGFSERLVPALLAKTEGRANGEPSPESDRYKPSSTAAEGISQGGTTGTEPAKAPGAKPSQAVAGPSETKSTEGSDTA